MATGSLFRVAFLLMNVEIRKATQADVPQLIAFLQEFASFENLSEYLTVTPERLANALFSENAFVECLIAFRGETALGYVLFFPYFSSFRGECGLYLDDLFVHGRSRGEGVGLELLKAVARTAINRGYERIDFQVLGWNEKAINFYKKLGAVSNDDEIHFKFSSEPLRKLAT